MTSTTAGSLRRAAEAIEVAGDVLATHLRPDRRPRTPEGAAIRAGGGVVAALADVARLIHDVLDVDFNLLRWISRADPILDTKFAPLVDALSWVLRGPLNDVADGLIVGGAGETPLLRMLGPATTVGDASASVGTASEAVGTFRAVRDWLWQEPGQVHAVHLRIAAQLGVAVCAMAQTHTYDKQARARAWRRAAVAASQLRGSPPRGAAAEAAVHLRDVSQWARERLTGSTAPVGDGDAALRRLADELPILAEALHRAVPLAVGRNDVYVSTTGLHRPPTAVIHYAITTWRLATMDDPPIAAMQRAFAETRSTIRAMHPLAVLSSQAATARLSFPTPADSLTAPDAMVIDQPGAPVDVVTRSARPGPGPRRGSGR